MDDLILARAIHVAAIVHWIGGVSFVTLMLLPGIRRLAAPEDPRAPVRAGGRRHFRATAGARGALCREELA